MTIRARALPILTALAALSALTLTLPALRDSPSAYALEFTVTRFDDPVPDGCQPDDCSLREAIIATNSPAVGPDVIRLPPGTYRLTRQGGSPSAAVGDLDIDDDLAIIGHSAATTIIDASQLNDRIFDLTNFVTPASIENVTLRNGRVTSGDGGIIRNYGVLQLVDAVIENGTAANGNGGAIATYGDGTDPYSLTLIRTTVRNSEAALDGGGIYSTAQLTITDSTISDNEAGDEGGGIAATQTDPSDNAAINRSTVSGNQATFGGGVQLFGGGTLLLTNSTVSGNAVSDYGGGINNFGGASAVLVSTTITANHAGIGGGGLGGDFTARNTIVSGNADSGGDPDCYGEITLHPINHLGVVGPNCTLAGLAPYSTGDAMLGPLAWNGGFTETHALQPGSPAIDGGADTGCTSATGGALATDQRGGARQVGVKCDIGAYESGAVPPPTPTPIPTPEPTPTPTPWITSTPAPSVTPTATPGPTLAPGECPKPTPTPTPTPSPTPTPVFFPQTILYACNDTGSDALGIHVTLQAAANFAPLKTAPPGCGAPTYRYQPETPAPLYEAVDVIFPEACIDPGETIVLWFASDCPGCTATITGFEWLLSLPTESPGVTGSPPPTALQGDVNCDQAIDTVDSLFVLRDAAGFPPTKCIDQGDVDCDGDRDSVDALGILRYVAALPPLVQNEPCPDIGTPL